MRVISPGNILMVSFHPESDASGARLGQAPPAHAPCDRYLATSKFMLPPMAPAELGVKYGSGGPNPGMYTPGANVCPLNVPPGNAAIQSARYVATSNGCREITW